jgi:glyoxylase-like metal-dependent hydrolase (beta-lactamase superfamily II)
MYGEAIGLRWASPDITFTDRMSIHWSNTEVILQHQPGPTPGSIWVSIPEKRVLFIGDTVFLNQPPFLADAELDAWIESIDLLLQSYRDYVIICSRGGLVKLNDLRDQKRILQNIGNRLESFEKRNAEAENVEKLVKPLIKEYDVDADLKDHYATRLYHGLFQYYLRSNRLADDLDQLSENRG